MALEAIDSDAFGVSRQLGFLGSEKPIKSFTDDYYAPWESILENLSTIISGGEIKRKIDELPILDTTKLSTDEELQHAYVALAFIIHGYVWGGNTTIAGQAIEKIPPQLSEPFLEVCERLDTQPVLSYSGLCLWNWACPHEFSSANKFPSLEELGVVGSFTGEKGEDAFYLVPVMIEAEGGHLVPLLLDAVVAAARSDFSTLVAALETAAESLKVMAEHLPKLFAALDAHMFYHKLRPFFAGGKGAEEKGLPRGMVFQTRNGIEKAVQCIGGSAAQSSLFPFLDSVLGVKHQGPSQGEESIFQEMRRYMPGKHRKFLDLVATRPSVRSFVEQRRHDTKLAAAYDECLRQLRLWRSKHIAVVSKYIVQPARAAAKATKTTPETSDGLQAPDDAQLRGTGGSELIPFLRQARDDTIGINPE